MVKGISKQVIVVHAPEDKMFEQAIFFLSEEALGKEGITDEALLKEAKKLLGNSDTGKHFFGLWGAVWACGGALLMGAAWVLTLL